MSGAHPLLEPEQRAAFLLRLRGTGVRDLRVLRAMESVPRAAFFPKLDPAEVLRDIALPLPCGQSAERPSSVALGLTALALRDGDSVLEVGTGSGYVTAVLVRIGLRVTTLERRRPLAEAARQRLAAVGLTPQALHWADGLADPPQPARFAHIVLHAAVPAVPSVLLDSLEPEGRLLYTAAKHPRRLRLVRFEAGHPVESDVGPSTASSPARGLSS